MHELPPERPPDDTPEPPDALAPILYLEPGLIPPDPEEPPPVELWSTVGGVPPWGSVTLLLAWALALAAMAVRHQIGDHIALIARGASLAERDFRDASWRLLASTFLHGGYRHLFFNSLSMLVFGPAVERIFARWSFWIVFGWGGAIASLASLSWRLAHGAADSHISVGASGAIFALAGALLTGAFRLRKRLAVGRARALAAAILFLAAPAIAQGFQTVGTDNAAHVGGATAGLLLGAIVPLSPRLGGRPGVLTALAGALAALALAASFARGWLGG